MHSLVSFKQLKCLVESTEYMWMIRLCHNLVARLLQISLDILLHLLQISSSSLLVYIFADQQISPSSLLVCRSQISSGNLFIADELRQSVSTFFADQLRQSSYCRLCFDNTLFSGPAQPNSGLLLSGAVTHILWPSELWAGKMFHN